MYKGLFVFVLLVLLTLSLDNVTELTDENFDQLVKSDQSIWLVLFAADWCGHCQHLKPQIQKAAVKLQKLGVKVGHVDEKNNRKLINDYVVDHNTHMVSYPKLKVFLGPEVLTEVPSSMRNAQLIFEWLKKEYSLSEIEQEQL